MNAVNGVVVFGLIWILSFRNDKGVVRIGDSGKAAKLFRNLELKVIIKLRTDALRVRCFTPEILGRVLKV